MAWDAMYRWCREATGKIKYPPDRRAVREELMGHLEDKREEISGQGLSGEALDEAVLTAMGDARTLAPQLAAVHRPFWGFAYSICKYLAIALICAALVALAHTWLSGGFSRVAMEEPAVFTQSETEGSRRIYYAEPDTSVRCEGYTFRVTRVALWEPGFPSGIDPGFYFRLAVTKPLLSWRCDAVYWLWAEDSLGNRYLSPAETDLLDPAYRRLCINSTAAQFVTWRYDMSLMGSVSREAEWVDLHYDRDGRDLTLRIDLREVDWDA